MAAVSPDLPPLSEVARIDGEIAEYVHRAFAEDSDGSDMGRLNTLIRERAEASLPRALVERVRARRERALGQVHTVAAVGVGVARRASPCL